MDSVTIFSPEKSKKEVRQMVYNKLADAMGEFKSLIKKKRFDDRMLTATRLFADDIIKSSRKARKKNKELVKKETSKNGKSKTKSRKDPADISPIQ